MRFCLKNIHSPTTSIFSYTGLSAMPTLDSLRYRHNFFALFLGDALYYYLTPISIDTLAWGGAPFVNLFLVSILGSDSALGLELIF